MLQEDDAIVWELLGHATRIWHIATAQLPCRDDAALTAAKRIFGYWSSRQAWLVSASCVQNQIKGYVEAQTDHALSPMHEPLHLNMAESVSSHCIAGQFQDAAHGPYRLLRALTRAAPCSLPLYSIP